MDDRTYELIVRLAMKLSNYYTVITVLLRIVILAGALTVGIELRNLLVSKVLRQAMAYRQVVRPMARRLGIEDAFYTGAELDRIYRIFLNGLRAERERGAQPAQPE